MNSELEQYRVRVVEMIVSEGIVDGHSKEEILALIENTDNILHSVTVIDSIRRLVFAKRVMENDAVQIMECPVCGSKEAMQIGKKCTPALSEFTCICAKCGAKYLVEQGVRKITLLRKAGSK